MALRVLLADESHTIKKVFQLALQDYAVEVRPVNIGLDVLPVAKIFKPDIVFADVLLQKKSGYDVCAEIKNDSELKDTPVILMWSGFMDLDDDKVQASRANSKLEKPFDVNALRTIVQEFVPKTKTQRLSGFLTFPDRPDFAESPPPAPPPPDSSLWNMESFDPIEPPKIPAMSSEEFHPVSLTKPEVRDQDLELISDTSEDLKAGWKQKSISHFKVDLAEDATDDDLHVDYVVSAEPISVPQQSAKGEALNEDKLDESTNTKIEKLVEQRAQALIEEVVWKVVPELASRIIEREIQKLLAEKEA